ncbi:unnamed protein product [Symbiodinium sp. CCMP2592]|nr:unnamed protein product [Symbiodinium sp. CCMP2592]
MNPSSNGARSASTLRNWSELLLENARLQVLKRRAVGAEDFSEAGRIKRAEAALAPRLARAREEAVLPTSVDFAEKLQHLKKQAVSREDFAEAGRLKKLQEPSLQADRKGDLLALLEALLLMEEISKDTSMAAELHSAFHANAAATAAGESQSSNKQEVQTLPEEPQVCDKASQRPAPPEQHREECSLKKPDGGQPPEQEDRPVARRSPAVARAPMPAEVQSGRKRAFKETEAPKKETVAVASEKTPRSEVQAKSPTKQELWIKAWEMTWWEAEAVGQADNHTKVYKRARSMWKRFLSASELDGCRLLRCAKMSRVTNGVTNMFSRNDQYQEHSDLFNDSESWSIPDDRKNSSGERALDPWSRDEVAQVKAMLDSEIRKEKPAEVSDGWSRQPSERSAEKKRNRRPRDEAGGAFDFPQDWLTPTASPALRPA